MDAFITIILIFGIPSFFLSKLVIDHFRDKNIVKKEENVCIYRYIIELKGEAIGKVQPNNLREVGIFDVYGTSGAGLQGTTHLKQDVFKDYLCNTFSIAPNLVKVIDPCQYIGLR